jgi:hypothetical protein
MNDLDVARDDLLLDALAAGLLVDDDPAVGLLSALRTSLDGAVAPLAPLAAAGPVGPVGRARRSLAVIALSAAAGLAIGAFGAAALARADRPGDLLNAARQAVLGGPDRASTEATALLDQAAGALARGDRAGARRLLAKAGPFVGRVGDEAVRERLRARLDALVVLAAEPPPGAGVAPRGAPGTAGIAGTPGAGSGESGRAGPSGTDGTDGTDRSGTDGQPSDRRDDHPSTEPSAEPSAGPVVEPTGTPDDSSGHGSGDATPRPAETPRGDDHSGRG